MLENVHVGDYIYCEPNRAWKVIGIDEYFDPIFIIEDQDSKIIKSVTGRQCSWFKLVPKDENGDWLFVGDKVLCDNHGDIIELTIEEYDTCNSEMIYATNSACHEDNYYACTLARKDSYSYENIYKDVDEILTSIENNTKKLKELLKRR